mgnify:CR=1 FL=1
MTFFVFGRSEKPGLHAMEFVSWNCEEDVYANTISYRLLYQGAGTSFEVLLRQSCLALMVCLIPAHQICTPPPTYQLGAAHLIRNWCGKMVDDSVVYLLSCKSQHPIEVLELCTRESPLLASWAE